MSKLTNAHVAYIVQWMQKAYIQYMYRSIHFMHRHMSCCPCMIKLYADVRDASLVKVEVIHQNHARSYCH